MGTLMIKQQQGRIQGGALGEVPPSPLTRTCVFKIECMLLIITTEES